MLKVSMGNPTWIWPRWEFHLPPFAFQHLPSLFGLIYLNRSVHPGPLHLLVPMVRTGTNCWVQGVPWAMCPLSCHLQKWCGILCLRLLYLPMLCFFRLLISMETCKLETHGDLPGLPCPTGAKCCCRPSCWRYSWVWFYKDCWHLQYGQKKNKLFVCRNKSN